MTGEKKPRKERVVTKQPKRKKIKNFLTSGKHETRIINKRKAKIQEKLKL